LGYPPDRVPNEGIERIADDTVGLTDIVTRLPGLLIDAPVIVRAALTGFPARRLAKTSISKVFQDRAARYSDRVFIRFDDQTVTYRQANETANRCAAVLTTRGVGRGDVVGIMLTNSPSAVLLMLASHDPNAPLVHVRSKLAIANPTV
jgi:fatty-acyl-CoA synthase